jgi:hypothetical protein
VEGQQHVHRIDRLAEGAVITRRSLFGLLALTTPFGLREHSHEWRWSPYLVTAFSGPHSEERLLPLQVCAVKGCGMLRMWHGEDDAGKVRLEQ